MPEQTNQTLHTLLEPLQEQRALLTAIREREDSLHDLMKDISGRLKRLEHENTLMRTLLRRMEDRLERRIRERISSLNRRVTNLESSRR